MAIDQNEQSNVLIAFRSKGPTTWWKPQELSSGKISIIGAIDDSLCR